MEMRTKLELLRLLREKTEVDFVNGLNVGVCSIVKFMHMKGEIGLIEYFRLNWILRRSWHLSKYPTGVYKFDTMQERLDFLDMLIVKKMKMRSELELLKLLRKGVDERLKDYPDNHCLRGICYVANGLYNRNKISHSEFCLIDKVLKKNWHLSKHPERMYKFDTKQERLDFLDMLIEKYEGMWEG